MGRELKAIAICSIAIAFSCPTYAELSIEFDFSLDTLNFFDTTDKKNLLKSAGDLVASKLTDSLERIPASTSGASWGAIFDQPRNGSPTLRDIGEVPANTVKIFVGGRNNLGSTSVPAASDAGTVSLTAGNTAAFDATVKFRGQFGAEETVPTDFGPWGGSIGFNTTINNWSFTSFDESPGSNQIDFLSVAIHEIVHVLGFGTAPSWNALVSNNRFHGTEAMALNNDNPVPLDATNFHWDEGTNGRIDGIVQEAALDPILAMGTRKLLTDLDVAALDDIGWQIIPEPSSLSILGVAVLLSAAGRRRSMV